MQLEEIKQRIKPLLREAGVKHSAIFGSFARGEATAESDVDLLVALQDDASLLDVVALKLKLESALQRGVDLVEFNAIKPRLRNRILRDQVPIL